MAFDFLSGPFIGIAEKYDIDKGDGADKMHFLLGDPTKLTMAYADSFSFLTGAIPNGMIYTFSTKTSDINHDFNNNIRVFPNPATDRFFIETTLLVRKVKVIDISGKVVISKIDIAKEINTNGLCAGTYFVEIETEGGVIRKKILLN